MATRRARRPAGWGIPIELHARCQSRIRGNMLKMQGVAVLALDLRPLSGVQFCFPASVPEHTVGLYA
jgi:hypothetical protein